MKGNWRHDPGPCQVDDAPHTTCCSPDYIPAGTVTVSLTRSGGPVTVAVERPRVLALSAPVEPQPAVTFTSGEYRRAVHSSKARGAKKR